MQSYGQKPIFNMAAIHVSSKDRTRVTVSNFVKIR